MRKVFANPFWRLALVASLIAVALALYVSIGLAAYPAVAPSTMSRSEGAAGAGPSHSPLF